ncbi:MAG TPA: hypothetical protein VEN81_03395, partial [Planctomycetota bacterium]|nr:hypothetical protein [Planctomycetota bacterium]
MMNSERVWLALAWMLIVGAGLTGVLWIRASDSSLSEPAWAGEQPKPSPPSEADPAREAWDRFHRSQDVIGPVRLPITPYVACLVPEIVAPPPPPPGPGTEYLLPKVLYSGKAGMDRVTLSWTLEDPALRSTPELLQKRSAPRAIVIHRQFENGEFEPLAVLDPAVKSFVDREIQPNRCYRYWIAVRGDVGRVQGRRSSVRTADQEGQGEVDLRTPAWHRVALKGGDTRHAILALESYNPEKDRW